MADRQPRRVLRYEVPVDDQAHELLVHPWPFTHVVGTAAKTAGLVEFWAVEDAAQPAGRERRPTPSEVLEALVLLTDSANHKLMAGPNGDDVRRAWEKRPTVNVVPKAGWG